MISPDYLFQVRTAVARHGEQDVANWWPTQGLLGPRGRALYARSFPRTHSWARARVVTQVATRRVRELYPVKDAVTLWTLPAELEDRLELARQEWLRDPEPWSGYFEVLEGHAGEDLSDLLFALDLVSESTAEAGRQLSGPGNGPALPVPGSEVDEETVALLAAAHAAGANGEPVVPHLEVRR